MKFSRDGRKKSGVEILPKPIPEDKREWVTAYVERICTTIRSVLPPDFDTHGIEDQKADVGNVIYPELHGKGFTDGQILTILNTIFSLLRQPPK